MKLVLAALLTAGFVVVAGGAIAAEKTVTLSVPGMYCASCPYIVKQSLAKVGGVGEVKTALKTKTATVTYDDQKTNIAALTAATANAGYPSHPVEAAAAK
jgi:mercuric ion binding protein